MNLTFVDALLVIIVLAGLVLGYSKGLLRQATSLVSWLVGIVLCRYLGDTAVNIFTAVVPSAVNWPFPSITVRAVALVFTFLAVMLLLRLASRLIKGVLNFARLGWIDRWGGAALYIFKCLFIVSAVLNLLFAINPNMDTFGTRHALNNKPYEFTLDLMPRVLGSEQMPSDSLKLYRDLIEPLPVLDQ